MDKKSAKRVILICMLQCTLTLISLIFTIVANPQNTGAKVTIILGVIVMAIMTIFLIKLKDK